VGRRAAQVVDRLVTRGKQAAWVADEARQAGLAPAEVAITYTAEDAIAAVRPLLDPGTVVLVKGSAVARMEQVTAGLLADPGRAPELLVRQDAAWRQIVVLQPDRPTWLEVDLGAIARNVRYLKAAAGQAALMAVLKGDAYGHGAVQVAHTALHNGADWCGVACLSEAAELRRAGIDAPILVLGYTPAWQASDAVRLGLCATVFDRATAAAFSQAAQALAGVARVHVKVDSGMHRLGRPPAEVADLLADLRRLPHLEVEGLFTHLAMADDLSPAGQAATAAQLACFEDLLVELSAAGLRPPMAHAANSAALLTRPEARFDLVRPGIALYGLAPSADVGATGLSPALAWKTQVAGVRAVAAGEAVGYGHAWRARRASRIATIPVGYADGFRRGPSTWRHVLVRGQPAPVVGRVSMDQTTIDVTDIPGARQGDEVVLIGRQGAQGITVDEVAAWLGTIGYEVVSAILARVPRVS
jgi:alanine racemase